MKKKIVIICMVVVAVAAVCGMTYAIIGNPILIINENKLNKAIASIDADTDTIMLNELIPFKWDSMYVIEAVSQSYIDSLVNDSPETNDGDSSETIQVVFEKKSKIVCGVDGTVSEIGYNIVVPDIGEIYYEINYSENTMFNVTREADGTICLTLAE